MGTLEMTQIWPCGESNIESHQSLTFVMDYYFFRQFASQSFLVSREGYFSRGLTRCRKITVGDEKKKKEKKSMLRVKETESFPGGGVRGRWKMELTSKLTRRQRGGLIKGAFVIANCVFGGLHRLPSNKPAIYSLRHAHRMSMSWIRLQRKPTKTAVSGCNLLENSANFANPISRLDPNKHINTHTRYVSRDK